MASSVSEGLCPQCLMAMNMASQTNVTTEGTQSPDPGTPLKPSEIAKFFPQFEIIELLGRGGMGVVYQARQKSLDRLVALKILAPEREKDEQFAERFTREARILASLSHSNIVTVHDFGETGGMYYLVMELVDGVNLRELLKQGVMNPERALSIVPDICVALEYAHQQGVVHRDIKPENVLVDKQGRVKIADFGIAKILGKSDGVKHVGTSNVAATDELTKEDRLGTPSYMAPEQVEQPTQVDHRADIYSLGVVFYELLTGELPTAAFQPPSKKVAVDVRIDEAVIRAIEKEPERRYQTAAQMKGAVETVGGVDSVPPTFFDWRIWSPGQSEKAREVCANMTESERRGALQRDIILGFMLAIPLIVIYIAADIHFPDTRLWQLLLIQSLVVLLALPIYLIRERSFLCTTAWAKRQGIRPDELKGFSIRLPASRLWKWFLVGVLGLSAGLFALVVWLERPRPIGRIVSGSTPDNMMNADAQTLHAMRIFGGDESFYRFRVQGYAGSISRVWDVTVPFGRLAQDFVLLSLDEVQFDRNGTIVWSEDGLRVSFRVNNIEVDAFNTEDGSHSFESGFTAQQEVVLVHSETLQHSFLDLDTGRVLSAPRELIESLESQGQLSGGAPQVHSIQEWMQRSGADLVLRSGVGLTGVHGLTIGVEKTGPLGDPRAFDVIPTTRALSAAAALQKAFENNQAAAERQSPHSTYGVEPTSVAIVSTREGGVGLVDIVEDEQRRSGVRLRFKMVEQ